MTTALSSAIHSSIIQNMEKFNKKKIDRIHNSLCSNDLITKRTDNEIFYKQCLRANIVL